MLDDKQKEKERRLAERLERFRKKEDSSRPKPHLNKGEDIKELQGSVRRYRGALSELSEDIIELTDSADYETSVKALERLVTNLTEGIKKEPNSSIYIRLKEALLKLNSKQENSESIGKTLDELEKLAEKRGDVEDYLGLGLIFSGLGLEKAKEAAPLVETIIRQAQSGKVGGVFCSILEDKKREIVQLHEKAVPCFEKAVEKKRDWYGYLNLGTSLIRLGNYKAGEEKINLYERAVKCFKEAIKTRTSDDEYSKIHEILLRLNQEREGSYSFEKTVQELEEIVKKKDNEEDYYLFGTIVSSLGDEKQGEERVRLYETAVKSLKEGVKKRKGSLCFSELKDAIVKLNKEQKDNELYKTVVEELEEKVDEREDKNEYFWFSLILTRVGDYKEGEEKIGLYEKAAVYAEKSVKIERDRNNLHVLGETQLKLGQLKQGEERIRCYEKAVLCFEKIDGSSENTLLDEARSKLEEARKE
ncbi:hypothetical protein KY343_06135 [Candidatus Woesearchaeota archaeon]|nr:hypothetical protein [Candidatus Woesearchaeota archaeon]